MMVHLVSLPQRAVLLRMEERVSDRDLQYVRRGYGGPRLERKAEDIDLNRFK